ncbi:hypothetical protein CQA53_04445 [Helicobacter didelphidarum]|uniref:Uncharacterized protein n=1 Tax=Helicobacter didelphidarum TaxID=2040648 RepID=A0A3D8INV5_9HELI|nr:hypothetical protein [Helicobacter didelphidarum]RDU66261.1 hypothetical protein CQA53_04445 [Helicobacter didelphidarum]
MMKDKKKDEVQMLAELFYIYTPKLQNSLHARLYSVPTSRELRCIKHLRLPKDDQYSFLLNTIAMLDLKDKYKSHLPKITCLVVEHLTKLFKSFGYYLDVYIRYLDFDFDVYVYNAYFYRRQMRHNLFQTCDIKKVFHAKFLYFIENRIQFFMNNIRYDYKKYEANRINKHFNEFQKSVALRILESKIL